ncbi:glycosyltransferase family 4 protein [Peribacillus kribbensis]|uniref:glycosyltransferase family 4 protein n=1 Tax=Peribacillus kribbensis TaxID=356658 RepID=UPI00042319EE|nr:glycosyltransferase family 4 protein [Peribacillus kribbensis]
MKLSIVLNNIAGIGGVERVVTNFCNQLYEKYKCEIHIISLFSNNDSEIFYDLKREIKVIHLGNKNLKNIKVIRQFFKFKKENYNFMLCCSVSISLLALITKVLGNNSTKIIAWEHSQYDNTSPLTKRLRKISYPFLDHIITLSKHDRDIFKNYLGQVSVIPNFKSFKSKQVSNYTNHKIISVGRLGYEKGFDMLIEAINLIKDQMGDWILEIYGEGKEYDVLSHKISQYNLENKVFIRPFTPNIKEKYLDASIFICSSRSESFSMVIIEAMECGLPCISFNCKIGPQEIITEGVDGFLVGTFNIEELSNKIKILIQDSNLRVEMGANAKKKSSKYDVDMIMDDWEHMLSLR